jgi:TPR repeat protein
MAQSPNLLKATVAITLLVVPSLHAQVAKKSNSGAPTPSYFRAEHERAAKGDVMAMIAENAKRRGVGLPTLHDEKRIIEKLSLQARGGNATALLELARMRRANIDGVLTPEMEAPIKKMVLRAAELGDPAAMHEWAAMLGRELGAKTNEQEIAYWYFKAWDHYEAKAKRGDVKAMVALANLIPPGVRAIGEVGGRMTEWRDKAAEHGDPESMFFVGMELMVDPRGHGRRYECVAWLQRSAEAGYWRAMLQLALFYARGEFQRLKGEEPRPDPVMAWEWVDRAVAATGNKEIWKVFIDPDDDDFMEGFPPRPKTVRADPKLGK